MAFKQALVLSLLFGATPAWTAPATGFGSRNNSAALSPSAAPPVTMPRGMPPPPDNAEWVRVSYEKAENEVLALFRRDLTKLEDVTQAVVLYEVRTPGLPANYAQGFRNKLERILLTSKRLHLTDCPTCDQSRIVIGQAGQIQYESQTTDPARPVKIASDLGVPNLLFAELAYTPEDLALRVRMVEFPGREVRWNREYSAVDVVKSRERYVETGRASDLGSESSLSRVILGEVAFSTVLSTGIMLLPLIKQESGGGSLLYPSVDLLIGEKYDRSYKRFGFLFGAAINMAKGSTDGKPLPFLIRIAPQYRYTFNPYNISSTRYSVIGEFGGMISSGMVTGYVGAGVEVAMVERFSVSLVPMYILPTEVSGAQVMSEKPDGTFDQGSGPALGRFGGVGLSLKGSINW